MAFLEVLFAHHTCTCASFADKIHVHAHLHWQEEGWNNDSHLDSATAACADFEAPAEEV